MSPEINWWITGPIAVLVFVVLFRFTAARFARLVRLGELPVVVIPSEGQEAARDLVRAREDVRGDLMRSRHRLSKLLLRQGIVRGHRLDRRAWEVAAVAVLRQAGRAVRVRRGLRHRADHAGPQGPVGQRDPDHGRRAGLGADSDPAGLPARGGDLTGFGLAVEIGDWHRFTGNSIGSFLGLTPSEHSSGGSRSVGSITKTGNGHARRSLVESSWHHRKPKRLSAEMIRPRGRSVAAGPRSGRPSQPAPGSSVAHVRRPQQAPDRRRGRGGQRAGQMVLVAGRHGRAERQQRHEQAEVAVPRLTDRQREDRPG